MELIETGITGLFIIKPRIFEDSRGYFFESYSKKRFEDMGLNYDFVQDNQSKSSYGVIRGLHSQANPFCQAKLVRCLEGSVLDVAVDIRKNSPTFGQHFEVELTAENQLMFMIPQGFLHGFSVLSKTATFAYKCDNLYHPENEQGINPYDESLSIDWRIPTEKALLSDKDSNAPRFETVKAIEVVY